MISVHALMRRLAASDPAQREEPLLAAPVAREMLAAILLEHRPTSGTVRRKVAIGGALLSLAVAGTAIASGVPQIVSDALNAMDNPGFDVGVHGAHVVASAPDGRDVLELYVAPGPDGGRCLGVVRRSPGGKYRHETGFECARGPSPSALDITFEGNETDGLTLYGKAPHNATVIELLIPGQPPQTLPASEDYLIARTTAAAFEKGYLIVARDRNGTVIARSRYTGSCCDRR